MLKIKDKPKLAMPLGVTVCWAGREKGSDGCGLLVSCTQPGGGASQSNHKATVRQPACMFFIQLIAR